MIGTPDDGAGFDPVQTIDDYADYYGVPVDLAQSVMQRESGGNHYDRDGRVLASGRGYRGLMGVHPVTAAGLGLGFNADDPEENVHAGLKYLGQNLEEFEGNPALALAGYHSGPHRAVAALSDPGDPRTKSYVKSILGPDYGGYWHEGDESDAASPGTNFSVMLSRINAAKDEESTDAGSGSGSLPEAGTQNLRFPLNSFQRMLRDLYASKAQDSSQSVSDQSSNVSPFQVRAQDPSDSINQDAANDGEDSLVSGGATVSPAQPNRDPVASSVSRAQGQPDLNAPIPPAKQAAVDPEADEPVRLSTDTTTANDLAASLPSLSAPDYETSGSTSWAHVQRVDDFVEPNGKGGYRLKKGIDPQRFLQTLADRIEMSLGFNEATQARYFQQYGHRPVSKFFYGIDPRNPGLTVDQILAAIETASDLKPGEVALPGYQGVPVFRSVMPPSVYAHYRQFLNAQPEVTEQRANMERDITEQRARDQQTRVDVAMRQIRPYLAANPAFAAALLPEILGLFSETAGRNARQFEEQAIRKATLGWVDPTLPGKAEGEQYDTPGATVGGVVGGALPMIGTYALGNAVGGPVGGGIATGLLPLIERRPDEPQYDLEQRAGEGLVQGATAGLLGPLGDASGAIAERIAPGSRAVETLLKDQAATGATAALTPLGTGRPMTRDQALQNLAFAYGMEVPGLIAGRSAPPAESRSPIDLSRNVVSREQSIAGIDRETPVVEPRTEPANGPLANAPELPQSAASAASNPEAYDPARIDRVLEDAYRSGRIKKHVYDAARGEGRMFAQPGAEGGQQLPSAAQGIDNTGPLDLETDAAGGTAASAGKPFSASLYGKTIVLPDVVTRLFEYYKRPRDEFSDLRDEFDSTARTKFLKKISNDPENILQLRRVGLTGTEIEGMRRGERPEGYQVHHKLSLDDTGTNDLDNLILAKLDPFHKALSAHQTSWTSKLKPGTSGKPRDATNTATILWPEFKQGVIVYGSK
ncbi:MAG TPA: transglycosylase SLT domain-containing protein [Blastocatellia bacterium]|nr:transglycosylase SLT domain-containing protein [Blastocatellia bacterium]